MANLFRHQKLVDGNFENLVEQCYRLLPGVGRNLALDGKAIDNHGRFRRKKKDFAPDRRRNLDADTGAKTYQGKREDGTVRERVSYWFGYKLHLIIDSDYELPVAFEVTPASRSEIKQAHALIDDLSTKRPEALKRVKGQCPTGV